MTRHTIVSFVLGCLALAACAGPTDGEAPTLRGSSPLVAQFRRAEAESGVPAELLVALAYAHTRMSQVAASDHAEGAPERGLLGLRPEQLAQGARLLGVPASEIAADPYASMLASAALLGELAGRAASAGRAPSAELGSWREVVIVYGGGGPAGEALSEQVFADLAAGVRALDDAGRDVVLGPRPEAGAGIGSLALALSDYPGARWVPASAQNYQNASRGAADVDHIVIHTTQGSYAGTVSWFQNPASEVSAHFVVRSSDGQITQMVNVADVAWHDACFNSRSVGIEHEGFVADPGRWYTRAMYESSAALSRWLADRYSIAKDRAHILGHGEAPDCSDHTDPGPGWDWSLYLQLVRNEAQPRYDATLSARGGERAEMRSGEEAVVWFELRNDGNTTWSMSTTRLGTQSPQDRESAFYKAENWISRNRATGADRADAAPGQVGRFTFAAVAPEVTRDTMFTESFQLVEEGRGWFGPIVSWRVLVHPRTPAPEADAGAQPARDGAAPQDGPLSADAARSGRDGGAESAASDAGIGPLVASPVPFASGVAGEGCASPPGCFKGRAWPAFGVAL